MKLASTLLLLVVLLCPTSAQTPPVCGDCNGDGVVSILDSLAAAQHAAGVITIVSPNFELCDIEPDFGDMDVDVLDSLRLAQIDVGLFPGALCTPASDELEIQAVAAPMCVGPGQTVIVTMDVRNPNPDPANITGSSLQFTNPAMMDVSTEYTVIADPGNPTSIGAGAVSQFLFTVDVSMTPSQGPITVDASITGVDSSSGVPVDRMGSTSPATWAVGVLFANFETGMGGWTATQDWQLGIPTVVPPKQGPTMFGTVLDARYTEQGGANPSGRSTLDSPAFSLVGQTTPVLTFTMLRDFEGPDWDGGNIKISQNGGATFTSIAPALSPTYDGPINPMSPGNPISGQPAWHDDVGFVYENVTVDLSAASGSANVVIRFDFGVDNFVTQDLGWYVDDILVCDVNGLPPGRAINPRPADGDTNVLALMTGTPLAWDPGAFATSYDVFFDTVNPPVTQIAASLPTLNFTSPPLSALTTYYWRVDSKNAVGTTQGFVWEFTTNSLTSLPGILINELETGTPDYVELVNPESVPIDVSGWTLEIHGNGDIDGTFTIPQGTVLDPGGYLIVADAAVAPGFRFQAPFNIEWNDTIPGEVILRTDMGDGIDYSAHNTATFPNLPMDLSWTGQLTLNGQGNGSRRNFTDTDTAANFQSTGTQSPRDKNPIQPFTLPSPRPFAPTPADGEIDVFPSPSGINLQWDLNGDFTSFDIRLDTMDPPGVIVAAGVPGQNFTTGALAVSTTYFWQVEAVNAVGRTAGPVWSFTTASSATPPNILINEVQTGAPDFVELFNNEMTPVDISGWQLSIFTNRAFGSPLDGTFVFPPGTVIAPCTFFVVRDGGGGPPPPAEFTSGFNIAWTNNSAGEVLLQLPGGVGVDYMSFNDTGFGQLPGDLSYSGPELSIRGTGIGGRVDFTDNDLTSDFAELGVETRGGGNPPQPPKTPPGPPNNPQPSNAATNVLARTGGHTLAWGLSSGVADSYDVLFGTSNPPMMSLGTVTEGSVVTPGLTPGTTYFWQVTATNIIGSTQGPVWSFTTGSTPGLIDPPIFINEMGVGATDFIELLAPAGYGPLEGMEIEFYDDGVLAGTHTIPASAPPALPAGLALTIAESGITSAPFITSFNIPWSTTNGTAEVILRNHLGEVLDYAFCVANSGGTPPPPSERPPQLVFFAATSPPEVPDTGTSASYMTVQMDTDSTNDWQQGMQSPGGLNPGQ